MVWAFIVSPLPLHTTSLMDLQTPAKVLGDSLSFFSLITAPVSGLKVLGNGPRFLGTLKKTQSISKPLKFLGPHWGLVSLGHPTRCCGLQIRNQLQPSSNYPQCFWELQCMLPLGSRELAQQPTRRTHKTNKPAFHTSSCNMSMLCGSSDIQRLARSWIWHNFDFQIDLGCQIFWQVIWTGCDASCLWQLPPEPGPLSYVIGWCPLMRYVLPAVEEAPRWLSAQRRSDRKRHLPTKSFVWSNCLSLCCNMHLYRASQLTNSDLNDSAVLASYSMPHHPESGWILSLAAKLENNSTSQKPSILPLRSGEVN